MANAMPGDGRRSIRKTVRNEMSCWIAFLRTNYLVLLIGTTLIYFPRLMLSFAVFVVAQFLRLVARVLGVAGRGEVANRRILVVTDYLPPQTHGIAIRCQAYVKEMRAQGHEVVVFSTAGVLRETSFDHPNIPSVVNPFNLKNRIGYNPGVKLAWFLGAYSWDVVHIFCPSAVSVFVCAVCSWRRIPVYASHHVEVEMFTKKFVSFAPIYEFLMFLYKLLCKWPSVYWATLNAAPTLVFAKLHCGEQFESRLRCVPSGTHDCFTAEASSSTERRDVRLDRFKVDNDDTRVIIMVQRLSAEKTTERIFPALVPSKSGERGVAPGTVLVLAGDGPARQQLEREAASMRIRCVFLGNVPHHELPQLYRAADCFVSMSMTETFGLTSLEAVMCGCPAVMPFCDVFNEIWDPRLPKTWRYNIDSLTELMQAIAAAQAPEGRRFLVDQPVCMTWKGAALELLAQYEECIEIMEDQRGSWRNVTIYFAQFVRIMVFGAISLCILSRYYIGAMRFGNVLQYNRLF